MAPGLKYFSFKAFQRGNVAEFKKIFSYYYKELYEYAIKRGSDSNSAEDIVTDSMVKLWDNRHKLKSEHHMEGWLRMVVRNEVIDERRRRDVSRTILVDQFPDVQEEGEAEAIKTDVLRAIVSLINELPPKRREIFCMHYIDGVPPRKIASKMGIKQSTVYNHLQDGIKFLKRKLSDKVLS